MASKLSAEDLARFQVGTVPSCYYIPDYVDVHTETRLMGCINSANAKWTQLSGRRLQNYGGMVHGKGLIPVKMPDWMNSFTSKLHLDTQIFGNQEPNHVLVNAYRPGEGIMPHEDGPLYHPGVCIVSFGGPVVLHFWKKPDEGAVGASAPQASFLLMPRSLLIFTDEAYTSCVHGILEVDEEELGDHVVNMDACRVPAGQATVSRGPERISFTVRRVLKVHKNLLRP